MKALLITIAILLTIQPVSAYQQHRDQALCWHRKYDDQHLAKHPDQMVREMYVRVFPVSSDDDAEVGGLGLELYISVRGSEEVYKGLALCRTSTVNKDNLDCKDGRQGGLTIKAFQDPKNETLFIDTRLYGGMSMYYKGDTDVDKPAYILVPGKDDAVFRVAPTMSQCLD